MILHFLQESALFLPKDLSHKEIDSQKSRNRQEILNDLWILLKQTKLVYDNVKIEPCCTDIAKIKLLDIANIFSGTL